MLTSRPRSTVLVSETTAALLVVDPTEFVATQLYLPAAELALVRSRIGSVAPGTSVVPFKYHWYVAKLVASAVKATVPPVTVTEIGWAEKTGALVAPEPAACVSAAARFAIFGVPSPVQRS
jgi:hypothetical protein